MTSNIKLIPNLICYQIKEHSEKGFSPPLLERHAYDLADRLTYFELVAMTEVAPLHFSSSFYAHDRLTKAQRVERDVFLKEGTSALWLSLDNDYKVVSVVNHEQVEKESKNHAGYPKENLETSEPTSVKPDENPTSEEDEPNVGPLKSTKDETAPQEQVIDAAVNQSLIVLAPPGSGKTEVLVKRLGSLVTSSEIESPADEIVVLSFSRAAVREVRERVARVVSGQGEDNLRYVNVRTFDSYASLLLFLESGSELIVKGESNRDEDSSYDRRILECLAMLNVATAESPVLKTISAIKCLLIDEIQDLVGVRAEFVLKLAELVHQSGGSLTILGDPAQAIYDYQVRKGGIRPAEFLSRIRKLLGPELRQIEFRELFRYSDVMKRFVNHAREAMGPDGTEPDAGELHQLIRNLGKQCVMSEMKTLVDPIKTTAFLTRRNDEAWSTYNYLRENGLPVELNSSNSDGWPPWLARIFLGFRQKTMSVKRFRQRWEERIGNDLDMSADEALASEAFSGLVSDHTIDLVMLRRRVSQTRPAQSQSRQGTLVVSTIHKSKGLEFDEVFLLSPEQISSASDDEVRVVYVAATRARHKFRLIRRAKEIHRKGRKLGDHFLINQGKEMLVSGLEELEPIAVLDRFHAGVMDVDEFKATQEGLWRALYSDGQVLELEIKHSGEQGSSHHLSTTAGDYVCSLSSTLSADLKRSRSSTMSVECQNLVTIAFEEDEVLATEGLGEAGMMLAPALEGTIRLRGT
jgi:hypothetical protein